MAESSARALPVTLASLQFIVCSPGAWQNLCHCGFGSPGCRLWETDRGRGELVGLYSRNGVTVTFLWYNTSCKKCLVYFASLVSIPLDGLFEAVNLMVPVFGASIYKKSFSMNKYFFIFSKYFFNLLIIFNYFLRVYRVSFFEIFYTVKYY